MIRVMEFIQIVRFGELLKAKKREEKWEG